MSGRHPETPSRARASAELLREAFERFSEPVALADAEDRIVFANRAFRALNPGLERHLEPGRPYLDHIAAALAAGRFPDKSADPQAWLQERREFRRRGGEFEIRRENGRWLLVRDERLPDGSTLTVCLDITARKWAEERARRAAEELQLIADSVPANIAYLDREMRLRYANRGYAEFFGQAPEHMHGRHLREVIGEDAWQEVRPYYERACAGESLTYQRTVCRPGRESVEIEVHVVPHRERGGEIVGIYTLGTDITARKRAEAALRASEERFRKLTELSADWYWEQDAELRFTFFSGPRAGKNARGGDPSLYLGKRRWELGDLEPLDTTWEAHRAQLERREPFRNVRFRRAMEDGSARYMSVSGEPVYDAEGRFAGYRGVAQDITAQTLAEERARQAAEQLRLVADNVPAMIAYYDRELRLRYANRQHAEFFDYPADRMLGRHMRDIIGEDAWQEVRPHFERAYAGEIVTYERTVRRPGREPAQIEVHLRPHRVEKGEVAGLYVMHVDITARKRAEAALRASEERFRKLTELSTDWYWEQDAELRFTLFAGPRAGKNARGGDPSLYLGKRRWELGDLEPLDTTWEAHRAQLERREPFRNVRFRRAMEDGSARYMSVSGEPVYDAEGRFAGYRGVAQDITAQTLAEERARQAAEQLRLVADNVPAMIAYYDRELRLRYANRQHAEFYGYALERTLGRHIAEVIGEDGWREVSTYVERVCAGEQLSYERTVRRPGREPAEIEVQFAPHRDGSGGVCGLYVLVTDITERKRAEAALRKAYAELEQAQALARLGSWNMRPASASGYWSVEMCRLFGRDPSSGAPPFPEFLELVHPEDRPTVKDSIRRAIRERKLGSFEFRTNPARLPLRHLSASVSAVQRDETDELVLHGTVQDVTERKLAEEAIRALNETLEQRVRERTAELEAAIAELEEFSYTVSHDLRAPARAAAGFARMLLDEEGGRLSDEGRRQLEVVERSALHMGRLVDDLLALARVSRAPLVRAPLDLAALAQPLAAELARRYPRTEFAVAPLPPATGDAALVRELLARLLDNAFKYSARAAAPRVQLGWDGERAYFVRDNGAGFDMAHAAKLFRPFERLHPGGGFDGTGIGLAIARRIVERHRGRIWAEAAPGEGATFRFTLPG